MFGFENEHVKETFQHFYFLNKELDLIPDMTSEDAYNFAHNELMIRNVTEALDEDYLDWQVEETCKLEAAGRKYCEEAAMSSLNQMETDR